MVPGSETSSGVLADSEVTYSVWGQDTGHTRQKEEGQGKEAVSSKKSAQGQLCDQCQHTWFEVESRSTN